MLYIRNTLIIGKPTIRIKAFVGFFEIILRGY